MTAEASLAPAPGRPREIEEPLNLILVHPLSRALVDRLTHTRVTPNQVSILSIVPAGGAAAAVAYAPWPWNAPLAFALLVGWHVLDGADGDLARRTGRASARGELIDGVCDHVSQGLVYVALAVLVSRQIGWIAWPLSTLSALCHALQANGYETARKTYRHYVYGAAWMRQAPDPSPTLAGWFNRNYLRVSAWLSPEEDQIARAMAKAGPEAPAAYQRRFAPLVKRAGLLGSTARTIALTLGLLAGSALWFLGFEIVGLSAVLAWLVLTRRRAAEGLARDFTEFSQEIAHG